MALAAFNTYLVESEEVYDQSARAERWNLRHAIPQVTWDTDPYGATMPVKYSAAPIGANAYPAKLGVEGICLSRHVNQTTRPGWVIVDLVYGWDATQVEDNSSYITMRTILVEQVLTWSLDDPRKPMTGPVYIADKPSKRVYGVKGDYPKIEIPYQIVRIYALLDETGRTAYAKPLVHKAGAVNDDSWTFGGMTFPKNTLKFRGVALDYSRRWGQSADHRIYNTIFEFIERPIAWPLTVDRYEWKKVVHKVDLVDDDANAVGPAKIGSLVPVDSTLTACIIRPEYAFDDILGSTAVPKLIS
jgi:hypothetical protein